MTKAGKKVLRGAREVLAFARGEETGAVAHVPDTVDVKAVRNRTGMTQREFAAKFGFGYDAVRDWEMHRRRPERTARVLLAVIAHEPDAVTKALSASAKSEGRFRHLSGVTAVRKATSRART